MEAAVEIREVSPTMLVDNAWKFMDLAQWWELMGGEWARGEQIKAVTIGYYKVCLACGWADPSTWPTRQEAETTWHECEAGDD